VGEAKERFTTSEFLKFVAYKKIEPWGDDWDQAAVIAATSYQGKAKKKLRDFRPNYKRKSQSADEMFAGFEAFAKRVNKGKHNGGKK